MYIYIYIYIYIWSIWRTQIGLLGITVTHTGTHILGTYKDMHTHMEQRSFWV